MLAAIGSTVDYAILIAYIVGILAFGSFFGRFTKTTKEFFFAGQRFSWWLIATSCVATLVGSYSFVKYSNRAYDNGFSATHAYLNDWPWLFLWLFGWFPVIYYARVASVPDYFEKRFGSGCRFAATLIILVYMIGYIGYNFLTIGQVLSPILGWDVGTVVIVVAVVAAIYVTAGGQTAVIMTDLAQGFLLLAAGVVIVVIGVAMLGGWSGFWDNWPLEHRKPFMPLTEPADFNSTGIFWQDGVANSAAFWFMNQGIILRFLSARSVREGRKAMLAVLLILMPLAALAVCGAGWIGDALENAGKLVLADKDQDVFVHVTRSISDFVAVPGMFGFIIAALSAALMSTADTLINGVSVVVTNDVVKPYLAKGRTDAYYLKCARWVSIAAAIIGVVLVPFFQQFNNLYDAHAAFTAAVTPPMVTAILLGFCWRRFTARGAMATMVGGIAAMALSMKFPSLIVPFSHGMEPGGEGVKAFKYIRACYGIVVSGALGVVVSLLTRPPDPGNLGRLVWGPERALMRAFKGSEPNLRPSSPVRAAVRAADDLAGKAVRTTAAIMEQLGADVGDRVFVRASGWSYGGLKAAHAVLSGTCDDGVELSAGALDATRTEVGKTVILEKDF